MQLQHLRRRLQALIGTPKSLPEALEILDQLYVELNASATFLTRRDMANFLYVCREALSWGPSAISKVSLVLDLLVSTDTYLLGQILTRGPNVSAALRKTSGIGPTFDTVSLATRPCRKYSTTQTVKSFRHDRFSRVDSNIQSAQQNQFGRIFQNADCVKAMCRLYKRFFNQISMAASMSTEESVTFFTDVSLCFVDFIKPILFILLRNTSHLSWFMTFLTSIFSYLVETDLSTLHTAGVRFFVLVSEVMFCIISPTQPFSERYISVNLEHSHLLNSRTILSRELISILNNLPIFKDMVIPSHFSSTLDAATDDVFHLTVVNPSNISNSDILMLTQFYNLRKDVPIITSVTSKYSLYHALFIHKWCSRLLIAMSKEENFATMAEFLLLLRILEHYAEIPIFIISHLSGAITPELFKLMTMDLMQELSLPLTSCLVSLNNFLAQFITHKLTTPVYTDLLAYMRNMTMNLILKFSVQMTAWSGENCFHVLRAFHEILPAAELLMRNTLRTLDGESVKSESEALATYSLTILQNYVSGLILFLRKATPSEIRQFFSRIHLGKLLDELLWPVHLFDQALLPAVASSLATLILELIKVIPMMFKDLILVTEMPSSIELADTLFGEYAQLIETFFHNLFLSPVSFFRVTFRYAEAYSSKKSDIELARVISSIKIVQHIFTDAFIKELFSVLLTETCYLNNAYSLLRIYKFHKYCEKERSQLNTISFHTEASILLQNIMKEDEWGLGYYVLELVINPMAMIIRYTSMEPFLKMLTWVLYSNLYLYAENSFDNKAATEDFMSRLLIAFRPTDSERSSFLEYYKAHNSKNLLESLLRISQHCILGDNYINMIPSLSSVIPKRHECTPINITEMEASLIYDVLTLLFYNVIFPSPAHPVLLRRCIMSLVDYCSDCIVLLSHLAAVFATREQGILRILTELPAMAIATFPPLEVLLQRPDYFKEDDTIHLSRSKLPMSVKASIVQYIKSDLSTILSACITGNSSAASSEDIKCQTFEYIRSLTEFSNYLSMDRFSTLELTIYCYSNIPFIGHSSRLSSMVNFIRLAPYCLLSNNLCFRSYVLRILSGEGISLTGDISSFYKSRNSTLPQNSVDMLIYPHTLASHNIYYSKVDFSFRKAILLFLNDHASVNVLVETSLMYILVILEHFIHEHAIYAEDMALATTSFVHIENQSPGSYNNTTKKTTKIGPLVRARPYRHKLDDLLLPLTRDLHEPNNADADIYSGSLGGYPSFVDFLRKKLHDYSFTNLTLSTFQMLPTTSFELANFSMNAEHPVQYSDVYLSGKHILSPIAFGELALLIKGRLGVYGEKLLNRFWASVPRLMHQGPRTKNDDEYTHVYKMYTTLPNYSSQSQNLPFPQYKHCYTKEELSKMPFTQLKVSIKRAVYHYAVFFSRQPVFFQKFCEKDKKDRDYISFNVLILLEQAWKLLGINLLDFPTTTIGNIWKMPVEDLLATFNDLKSLCAMQCSAEEINHIASLHYVLLSLILQSVLLPWPSHESKGIINGKALMIYILSTATAQRNYDVLNVFLLMMLGKCEHSDHVVSNNMRRLMIIIVQDLFLNLNTIDTPSDPSNQSTICPYGGCFIIGLQTCLFLEHVVRHWAGSQFPMFYICRFLLMLTELIGKLKHGVIIATSLAFGLLSFSREILSAISHSTLSHELIPMTAFALLSIIMTLKQVAYACAPIYSSSYLPYPTLFHPLLKSCITTLLDENVKSFYRLLDWLKQPPVFYNRMLFSTFSEIILPKILFSHPKNVPNSSDWFIKMASLTESIFFEIGASFFNNQSIFSMIKFSSYKQARGTLIYALNVTCDAIHNARSNLIDLKSRKFYAAIHAALMNVGGHTHQCFSNLCAFVKGMHYDAILSHGSKLEITDRTDIIRVCSLVQRSAIEFTIRLISGLSQCITSTNNTSEKDAIQDDLDIFLCALRDHLVEACLKGMLAFVDETRYARYFTSFGYHPVVKEQASKYLSGIPASFSTSLSDRKIFYVPVIGISWTTVELKHLYYELKSASKFIAAGLSSINLNTIDVMIEKILEPVISYYVDCDYPSPLFFQLGELLINYFNYISPQLLTALLSPEKLSLLSLTDESLYTELTTNKLFPYAYLIQYALLTKFTHANWIQQACLNTVFLINSTLRCCIYSFDKMLCALLVNRSIYQREPDQIGCIYEILTQDLLIACKNAINTLLLIDRYELNHLNQPKLRFKAHYYIYGRPIYSCRTHTPVGILSLFIMNAYDSCPSIPHLSGDTSLLLQIERNFLSTSIDTHINLIFASTSTRLWLLPSLCISYGKYLEYIKYIFIAVCNFIDYNSSSLDNLSAEWQRISYIFMVFLKLTSIALYVGGRIDLNPHEFVCLSPTSTRFDANIERASIEHTCEHIIYCLPEKLAQFRAIATSLTNSSSCTGVRRFYAMNPDFYLPQQKIHTTAFLHASENLASTSDRLELRQLALDGVYLNTSHTMFPNFLESNQSGMYFNIVAIQDEASANDFFFIHLSSYIVSMGRSHNSVGIYNLLKKYFFPLLYTGLEKRWLPFESYVNTIKHYRQILKDFGYDLMELHISEMIRFLGPLSRDTESFKPLLYMAILIVTQPRELLIDFLTRLLLYELTSDEIAHLDGLSFNVINQCRWYNYISIPGSNPVPDPPIVITQYFLAFHLTNSLTAQYSEDVKIEFWRIITPFLQLFPVIKAYKCCCESEYYSSAIALMNSYVIMIISQTPVLRRSRFIFCSRIIKYIANLCNLLAIPNEESLLDNGDTVLLVQTISELVFSVITFVIGIDLNVSDGCAGYHNTDSSYITLESDSQIDAKIVSVTNEKKQKQLFSAYKNLLPGLANNEVLSTSLSSIINLITVCYVHVLSPSIVAFSQAYDPALTALTPYVSGMIFVLLKIIKMVPQAKYSEETLYQESGNLMSNVTEELEWTQLYTEMNRVTKHHGSFILEESSPNNHPAHSSLTFEHHTSKKHVDTLTINHSFLCDVLTGMYSLLTPCDAFVNLVDRIAITPTVQFIVYILISSIDTRMDNIQLRTLKSSESILRPPKQSKLPDGSKEILPVCIRIADLSKLAVEILMDSGRSIEYKEFLLKVLTHTRISMTEFLLKRTSFFQRLCFVLPFDNLLQLDYKSKELLAPYNKDIINECYYYLAKVSSHLFTLHKFIVALSSEIKSIYATDWCSELPSINYDLHPGAQTFYSLDMATSYSSKNIDRSDTLATIRVTLARYIHAYRYYSSLLKPIISHLSSSYEPKQVSTLSLVLRFSFILLNDIASAPIVKFSMTFVSTSLYNIFFLGYTNIIRALEDLLGLALIAFIADKNRESISNENVSTIHSPVLGYIKSFLDQLLEQLLKQYNPTTGQDSDSAISPSVFIPLYTSLSSESRDIDLRRLDKLSWYTLALPQEHLHIYNRYTATMTSNQDSDKQALEGRVFTFLTHFNLVNQLLRSLEPFSFTIVISSFLFLRLLVYFNAFIYFILTNIKYLKDLLLTEFKDKINELVQFLIHLLNKNVGHYIGVLEPMPSVLFSAIDHEIMFLQYECNRLWHLISPAGYFSESNFFVANLTYHASDFLKYFIDALCRRIIWNIMCETVSWYEDESNATQRALFPASVEKSITTLVKFLKQRENWLTQNESKCYAYIQEDLQLIYLSLDSNYNNLHAQSSNEPVQQYILPAAFLYDITSPVPGEIAEDGVMKILFSQVLPQQPLNLLRQRGDAFLLLSLFMRLAARPSRDMAEFSKVITMYTISFATLSSFAAETYHEFITSLLTNGYANRHAWSLNLNIEKRDLSRYTCNYHPSITANSQSKMIGIQRLQQKLLSYLPTLRNLDNFFFTRNSFYRLILGLIVEFGCLPCDSDTIMSITEGFCRHIPQQSNTSMSGLIRNFSKTINFTSFIPTHAEPVIGGVGAGLPNIGNTAGNKYGAGLIWMFYELLLKQWKAGPPIESEPHQARIQSPIISRRFYTDIKHNVKTVLDLYNVVNDLLATSSGSGSIPACNVFQTPIDTKRYFIFSSQATESFYNDLTLTNDLQKIINIYLELLAVSMQLYDRVLFLPGLYNKIVAYRTKLLSGISKYNDTILKFEASALPSLERLERIFAGRKDLHDTVKQKWDEFLISVDKLYLVRDKLQSKVPTSNIPTLEDVTELRNAEKAVKDATRDYVDALRKDKNDQLELLKSYTHLMTRYFYIFNKALKEDPTSLHAACPEIFEDFANQIALHNGEAFALPRISEYSIGDIDLLRRNLYTVITSLFKILHVDVDGFPAQKYYIFSLTNLNKALTWELMLKRIARASIKLLNDKELQLGWLLPFKLAHPTTSSLLEKQYIYLATSNLRLAYVNVFQTAQSQIEASPSTISIPHSIYRPNFTYLQNGIGVQSLYCKIYQRLSPIDMYSMHFLRHMRQFREAADISVLYFNNFGNENPEEATEYMVNYLTELRSLYYNSFKAYFKQLPEDKYNKLFSFWLNETYNLVSHIQPRIAKKETSTNSSPILTHTNRMDHRYNMSEARFAFNGHLIAERNVEFINLPKHIINYFLNTHGTYVLSYFISVLRYIFFPNSNNMPSHGFIWERASVDFHQNIKAIRLRFERAVEAAKATRRTKCTNLQHHDTDKLTDFFNYLNDILRSPELNTTMQPPNTFESHVSEHIMASSLVPYINSFCVLANLFPGPSEELFGLHLPITVLSSSVLNYTQDVFSLNSSDTSNDSLLYSSPCFDDDMDIQPSVLNILTDYIFLFAYLYPKEAIEFVLKSAILKRSFHIQRNLSNSKSKPFPYSININAADFAHLAPIVGFHIATYTPTGYMPGLQGMALTYHLDDLVSGSGKYEQYCKSVLDLRTSTLYRALLADGQTGLASAITDSKMRGLLSCNLDSNAEQSAIKSAISCDAMLTNLTVESQIYLLYFALTDPLNNGALIRRLFLSIRDMFIAERAFLDTSMTSLLYQYADLSDIYSALLYSITAIKRACKQIVDKEMMLQGQNLQPMSQLGKKTVERFYRNYIHLPIVSLLSSFRTRHMDVYLAGTREISTWATCRLMVIISYTKVFSAPYQYLDDIYDDTTDNQARTIARSCSAYLWDSLRSNFAITRPHTLNSIIEHALLLGIPAAARVANKKEVNWNETPKLSNNIPYIAETIRCIRSQIFSLMESGKFFSHKMAMFDDIKATSQNNSFLVENIKADDNYAALNECIMYLDNPTFINDYIKNQKHLIEEIRTCLSQIRILVEKSEMLFPSTISENSSIASVALRNLGAGSNDPRAKDLPRYWQANADMFLHHIDNFIKQNFMPRQSSMLDLQHNSLTAVSLANIWDLLVSFFVSCMNSVSNINESNDIEFLNQLYETVHVEHVNPVKGIQEDDSVVRRRNNILRSYRNTLESRFCESRDRAALGTFNSLLNFVLLPPSIFHIELNPSIVNLYDGLQGFSSFARKQRGQWSMLDSILLYTLVTSIMHIHPHHISYNYRRIFCVISFYPRLSKYNSIARLGFLTGLVINMCTDSDRQYPTLLKDGNYTNFPSYHVSPRILVELTFILGIDILKIRNYLIRLSPIKDTTHQANISLLSQLTYWDILLVLLHNSDAYVREFIYLNSVYKFDILSAVSELAKRQPLLKEISPDSIQYKLRHDGLSLWIYLLQLSAISPENNATRMSIEGIENIDKLFSLQKIFIIRITQLISHDNQEARKKDVYNILLKLIIDLDLYILDNFSKTTDGISTDTTVSVLIGFGFLLFAFAYSIYHVPTILENESISLIAAFDGISAGAAPWYYSITRKLYSHLRAHKYDIFSDRNKRFLISYKYLILEKFLEKQQFIDCIDRIINVPQDKHSTELLLKSFETYVYNYMCYLRDIVVQGNLDSTEFWGIPSINTRRFRASQMTDASLGCRNPNSGATISPLLTDVIGGFFYDDGLLYSENSISSATHFEIDTFSGVLPSPDSSFSMPNYNSRTDRISSGIGNSLADGVLANLIHTSSYCKTPTGPTILFISGLPIVKLSMSNVSYNFGGNVDYLVLEIPNNPYVIECLAVLMPHAVPLRMGLYKEASNIINAAMNPSSHVVFWEKYINISRNVHVYQCKQTTYIDKIINCSAETFQYNYRKLFGVRKSISIGVAQKLILHELFNLPKIQLAEETYDFSTGEIISFSALTTPNMFGETLAFKELCLRTIIIKSLAAGQPVCDLHKCSTASQPRATIGQSLVDRLSLQILMSYSPLAISRAIRYMLLDSKSRYPQVIAQNVARTISVQNATIHISQSWANELEMQFFVNGLVEGYESLYRDIVTRTVTLLTSSISSLDSRIPISKVVFDNNDYTHVNDTLELISNESLTQPALEYVAYCIDAGIEEINDQEL